MVNGMIKMISTTTFDPQLKAVIKFLKRWFGIEWREAIQRNVSGCCAKKPLKIQERNVKQPSISLKKSVWITHSKYKKWMQFEKILKRKLTKWRKKTSNYKAKNLLNLYCKEKKLKLLQALSSCKKLMISRWSR